MKLRNGDFFFLFSAIVSLHVIALISVIAYILFHFLFHFFFFFCARLLMHVDV